MIRAFILTDHEKSARAEVALYCPELCRELGEGIHILTKIPYLLDLERPWVQLSFEEERGNKTYRDLVTLFSSNFSELEVESVVDLLDELLDTE